MKIPALLSLLIIALVGQDVSSYKVESSIQKPSSIKSVLHIRGGAKPKKTKIPVFKPSTTGASVPNEVFNLVKAIVGVGVLSLPAGKFVVSKFLLTRSANTSTPSHILSRRCRLRKRTLCHHSCCCLDCYHWCFEWIWLLSNWPCLLLHWGHFVP